MAGPEDVLGGRSIDDLSESEVDALLAQTEAPAPSAEEFPPAPEFALGQGVSNTQRGVFNNLLESRPGMQEPYLQAEGYETTKNEDGEVFVRPQGSQEPFRPIEGGDGSILGGMKEFGKDVTLDAANNILGMVPNALAGARGLVGNIATNAAGTIPTEMFTDDLISRYGGPSPEQTGDASGFNRGAAQGVLAGGLQSASGAIMGRLLGTRAGTNLEGERLVKESLTAPADSGYATQFTNAAGDVVPGERLPFMHPDDAAGVNLVSPRDEVLRSARDNHGFFEKVKTTAAAEGVPYHTAANKIILIEKDTAGAELQRAAEAIAKDPRTTIKFSDLGKLFGEVGDELNQSLRATLPGQPDAPISSTADQVLRTLNGKLEQVRVGLATRSTEALKAVSKLSDDLDNGPQGYQFQGQPLPGGLNRLAKQVAPYQKKLDAGKKLTNKETAKYTPLKNQLDAALAESDRLADQARMLRDKIADPDIPFDHLHAIKQGVYSDSAKIYKSPNQELSPEGKALESLGGRLGTYTGEVAGAGADKNMAAAYSIQNEKFSTFVDLEKFSKKAFTSMEEQGEKTWLDRIGVSRLMKSGMGLFIDPKPGPQNQRAAFEAGVRKLSTPDPMSIQNAQRNLQFANETINARAAPAKTFMYQQVARDVSPIIGGPEGIEALKKQITISLLKDNGLVSEAQAQEGFDIAQMDPMVMQQVGAAVQNSIAPLADAAQFGNEEEVGAAYSSVAKQFPELFPKPVTGIAGEVKVNGKVKLFDPMDRARYSNQIQLSSDMDWDEKADIVSELNSSFTVKNPKRMQQ